MYWYREVETVFLLINLTKWCCYDKDKDMTMGTVIDDDDDDSYTYLLLMHSLLHTYY